MAGSRRSVGEIEIVRKPAFTHQEADELLGGIDIATLLKNYGTEEKA